MIYPKCVLDLLESGISLWGLTQTHGHCRGDASLSLIKWFGPLNKHTHCRESLIFPCYQIWKKFNRRQGGHLWSRLDSIRIIQSQWSIASLQRASHYGRSHYRTGIAGRHTFTSSHVLKGFHSKVDSNLTSDNATRSKQRSWFVNWSLHCYLICDFYMDY